MMNEEFVKLVENMRAAQRDYFKTKKSEHLIRAKELETQVDKEIRFYFMHPR